MGAEPRRQGPRGPAEVPRFKAYVQGVVGAFAKDDRVLGWDVWNEPDNSGGGDYSKTELKPTEKRARVAVLLPQVFAWAREVNPAQPLTSGVWDVDTPKTKTHSRRSIVSNSASPTSSLSTTTTGPSPSKPRSPG